MIPQPSNLMVNLFLGVILHRLGGLVARSYSAPDNGVKNRGSAISSQKV